MTREEAINYLKSSGMSDEQIRTVVDAFTCEDCISRQAVLDYIHRIFNQGTGKKKSFEYIQKYVEKLPPVNPTKADVLDKIRAEFISLYPKNYAGEPELGGLSCKFSLNKALEIIDKYKAESEGSE